MRNDLTQAQKLSLLDDIGFGNEKTTDRTVVASAKGVGNSKEIIPQTAPTGNKVSPHEWEPPIPFNDIELPLFPIDTLPLTLRDMASAIAEATQTPVDMAAIKVLAVIATCVQGKYRVRGKSDYTEPVNIYTVAVLPPAERKSAVDGLTNKALTEYERTKNETNKVEIARSKAKKEVLGKAVELAKTKLAKGDISESELYQAQDEFTNFTEIKAIRLMADDVTPEALASLLADNGGKMSVISSEGGIFEILKGRYSQSMNLDAFLKGHSNDPMRIDRKGREPEYIESPCLTVSLSIQPHVLNGIMSNETFRGCGLSARFLYCIPKSKVGSRRFETNPIPDDVVKSYRDLIFGLLDLPQHSEPTIINLSPEAYTIYAEYQDDFEPRLTDDLANISDWAGKLRGAVLRIAGLLHLAKNCSYTTPFDNNPLISCETINSAIEIGCYFIEHAQAAYSIMGGADESLKLAQYILTRLEKHRPTHFTTGELLKLCKRFKTVCELTKPLNVLKERGYIRVENIPYTGTGRPPGYMYYVNPIFYKFL